MPAALIGQLLSACAGAYSAASSAAWWAASLPHTCKESLAHAALTCSGTTPRYFAPGFGPLALAWGWLKLRREFRGTVHLALPFVKTFQLCVACKHGRNDL